MTIKELAYTAQQHLESITGSSFKRAHIYELLASSFGFKSYAALCSDYVFTQRENDRSIPAPYQTILQKRVVELGYDPMATDVAASAFLSFVSEQHIDVVDVADLVDGLSDDDSFSEEFWTSPDSGEYPLILLESLEAKASKGDPLAHYALALLFKTDDEDSSQETGGDYWYSQEQQGRVLTGVEKEWADEHARHLEKSEKHAFHLREAGRLGNSSALLELAALFHDTSYFDAAIACGITDEPISVAELAESLGREEDVEHWLTVACLLYTSDAADDLQPV